MFDLSHEAVLDPILDDVNASPEILPAEPEAPTTGDKALEEQLLLYSNNDEPPHTWVDPLVVTGVRNSGIDDLLWQFPGLLGDNFEGFGDGDFVDTGSGDPYAGLYSACTDRKADIRADEVSTELAGKSDSNIREYGAIMWKDSAGNVHMTALFPGTVDAQGNRSLPYLSDSFLASLGVPSVTQIVGVIHSHPTHYVGQGGGTGALRNPADRADLPSHSDWYATRDLVVRGADASNLTVYISYQGTVKEFDQKDNWVTSHTSGVGAGVESGDYNPGQTCP